jgi:Uma2 family endonuclease
MLSFHANTVVVDNTNETFMLIGFADEKGGLYRESLMLQRGYEFDEQDIVLGMDRLYLERSGQGHSAYGEILEFQLWRDHVSVLLDEMTAKKLGCESEIEIIFDLCSMRFAELRTGLSSLFDGFDCFHDETQLATIDDLYHTEGRAELINGRIVHLGPNGWLTGRIVGRIAHSLSDHAESIGQGEVHTSTIAYVVGPLASGRRSFSPSTSYYLGPLPVNPMSFIEGPPTLAVEVRSEGDYGPTAEEELAAKRADYFEAGTKVVWDVDPLAEVIYIYRAGASDRPQVLHRGDVADAEPAVEGWRIEVDRVFGPVASKPGQIT